jgi:nitrate/TMAO reductase-like tetraheme cytochrome c subunit
MFKRFTTALRDFFLPADDAPVFVRVMPYLVLGGLTFVVLFAGVYAWEYTNSPEFCGTACHTMPPEYAAYQVSPHARVACVDCHIGKDFITTRVTRKAGDVRHIIAQTFKTYEYPIRAHQLRPARETCERCHFPEKFSDDSLREIKQFQPDPNNTPTSIYLTLKTGGGTKREGLGRGIHWHIENELYYLPLDPEEQEIPYVQVVNDDGSITEYLDIESDIDPTTIDPEDLKVMDCITCHNRISHRIVPPDVAVDELLNRELISPEIPEIRLKAVEALETEYESVELALIGLAALEDYYRVVHPEFYEQNTILIQDAVGHLQDTYQQSVFPQHKVDWDSHPHNIGHKESPGCFRCHDGKHLNEAQEAVRLECNLCHSIPVVSGPSDFLAQIEISRGPEPESHLNPNWITMHREVFDPTCENCHTVENPGGTDNSSFCSNSACHGNVWEHAGFDAPALREILMAQVPKPEEAILVEGPVTYENTIGPLFVDRCGACHAEDGIQGLNLTEYSSALAGGISGPAILAGDPNGSLVVQRMTGDQPHFGQLSVSELDLLIDWIESGAPNE